MIRRKLTRDFSQKFREAGPWELGSMMGAMDGMHGILAGGSGVVAEGKQGLQTIASAYSLLRSGNLILRGWLSLDPKTSRKTGYGFRGSS